MRDGDGGHRRLLYSKKKKIKIKIKKIKKKKGIFSPHSSSSLAVSVCIFSRLIGDLSHKTATVCVCVCMYRSP